MRSDLEEGLRRRHPRLLRNLHGDAAHSPLAFGIEAEDGWYQILERLLADLERFLAEHPDPKFEVRQIKQKFGSLRVSLSRFDDPKITELVAKACQEAKSTCEQCGTPEGASLRNRRGTLQTLCDRCSEGPSCS